MKSLEGNSDAINLPHAGTLVEAKRKFACSNYAWSSTSEQYPMQQSGDVAGNLEHRLMITQASISLYRQWVGEWSAGWKKDCFASLPLLFVSDEWLEEGDGNPSIGTVLAEKSSLYEPGDYASALQCHELPGVLDQIRWLNLVVCRDNKENGWVIWDYNAVNAGLQETLGRCSCLPKSEYLSFLLQLLRNLNLSAQQFCPLTRNIAPLETDTRIGTLSAMLAVVIDCLSDVHLEKDCDLSNVMRELFGMANFGGCDYILFDALQWFIA